MGEEPTAPHKRCRFQASEDGDTLQLIAVLQQYFTTPTKVTYEEKRGRSRSDVPKLRQHAALLLALKCIQCNCSFSQTTTQHCLATVGEAKKSEWKFSREDLEDWSTRVAQRVRCMCGHFTAAARKNTVLSGSRTFCQTTAAC